jgi:hypothetical protein
VSAEFNVRDADWAAAAPELQHVRRIGFAVVQRVPGHQ